jgi:uncharacterized Fe-S cluster-containing protein
VFNLLSADERIVASVKLEVANPPLIIVWGDRGFLRYKDFSYREIAIYVCDAETQILTAEQMLPIRPPRRSSAKNGR